MAKVSSAIENADLLGINAEMKKLIEDAEWDLVDVTVDHPWEDGKQSETVTGVTWLLVGPRKGDKRIRNKEITITSDEVVEQNILDAYMDAGATVKLTDVDVISVWAKGDAREGKTYAPINIKLGGHVEVIPEED